MEEIRALGYEFRGGRLLQIGSDEGFKFKDQPSYDALADAVLRYVGVLLVEEGKLSPVLLPLGCTEDREGCPIFLSEGLGTASRVLMLIQGSGRVRVGVWGCALCINEDLDQGTMLPYLRKAAESGYGVVVLNPNATTNADGRPIEGSETPDRHVSYVWEKVVAARCSPSAIIDVLAHSNGGKALLTFLAQGNAAATDAGGRIRRIVFTDSYHGSPHVEALPAGSRALLGDASRVVNFVPSALPFGTPVSDWVSLRNRMNQEEKGCSCLSAETEDHAATNHTSLPAAFAFFAAG